MNKIKIALVLCPCWTNLSAPLGIAYLSSMLKSKGYEVRCFDINIQIYCLLKEKGIDYWDFKEHYRWERQSFTRQILPLIKNYLKNEAEEILKYDPDVIGFSIFYTNSSASLFLAEEIKSMDPSKKIIFGGQECYKEINNFRFLNTGFIDAVVIGEGEETLGELVEIYSKQGVLKSIKGTIIKMNGELLVGGSREEIKDLNSLTFPDFNDFNLKRYKQFALPIITSRGCIGHCAFCGEIIYWNSFRYRRAENVLEELKQRLNDYGVKNFFFNDSLLDGNINELARLVNLIIENRLEIIWGGYVRVHKGLSLHFLKRLKKSGCYYLSYGIESGSQKVVDAMNKSFFLKDAEMNLRNTVNAGIETHVNWIVGFPTESWLDFFKSIVFIFRNRRNISFFNPGQLPCGILPDSTLARYPHKFGISNKLFLNNWRTKYFANTIIDRNLRLKILRNWISLLGINHS